MIEWLEKIAGVGNSGGRNAEREELVQLRKEVKVFKKKVNISSLIPLVC